LLHTNTLVWYNWQHWVGLFLENCNPGNDKVCRIDVVMPLSSVLFETQMKQTAGV
jgi:hypothetical protein